MSVKQEFQDMKQCKELPLTSSDPKKEDIRPQDAPEEDKDTPRQQSLYASGRETPLEQFFQRMVGSTSSRDWTEICLKSQNCPWARIMVPWSNKSSYGQL